MARRRKTFMDMLGSPLTLLPFTLGVGAAIVLWASADANNRLALFLAIAGSLVGLGMLLSLLVLYGGGLNPVLRARRLEMLASLADLADSSKFASSPEADKPASAALVERG